MGSKRGIRIVSGRLGGRRLQGPPGHELRPSAERTREAIFSMLGPELGGISVLDLFCGSGALGLEALSRGAGEIVLVDREIGLASANVASLELGADAAVQTVGSEAITFLERTERRFGLVLCDPPYTLAPRFAPELDRLLPDRLEAGASVVVECSPDRPLDLSLPLRRERRYGSALVRIYEAG